MNESESSIADQLRETEKRLEQSRNKLLEIWETTGPILKGAAAELEKVVNQALVHEITPGKWNVTVPWLFWTKPQGPNSYYALTLELDLPNRRVICSTGDLRANDLFPGSGREVFLDQSYEASLQKVVGAFGVALMREKSERPPE